MFDLPNTEPGTAATLCQYRLMPEWVVEFWKQMQNFPVKLLLKEEVGRCFLLIVQCSPDTSGEITLTCHSEAGEVSKGEPEEHCCSLASRSCDETAPLGPTGAACAEELPWGTGYRNSRRCHLWPGMAMDCGPPLWKRNKEKLTIHTNTRTYDFQERPKTLEVTNIPLNRTALPTCPSFAGSDDNPAAHTGACKDLGRYVLVKTRCYIRLIHLVMLGHHRWPCDLIISP